MLNNFLGQFFNGWCAAFFQQQIDSFENQRVQFGSFDMSDFAQLIVNGLFQIERQLTSALLQRSLPDRLLDRRCATWPKGNDLVWDGWL